MNWVSVIICHYSKVDDFGGARAKKYGLPEDCRSKMLRECIESLAKNTSYPAEIIVIDNGGDPDDSDYLLGKLREGVINTYVRNKNNMHFGWAFNQGVALATSEYICLTCNDIKFKKNWLTKTMEAWMAHKNRKLIASPFISIDKTKFKNPLGTFKDGCRLNSMAGSNCMIMTKNIYKEVGPMTTHHLAGSHFHRRMCELGYRTIAPPKNYVEEMAFRAGCHLKLHIEVKEKLLNKDIVNFTFPYRKK
jgi:glycosyltransferase involved in cell wall biosynthesis